MDDQLDPGLLSQVPCLAATPRTVEPLPGGLTNRNYKVTTPHGAFVARVWSPGDLLAINRDHEHRNSVAAAAARVAGACRLLHAGPRFAGDFDMFEVQRRYLDVATGHGFSVPAGYTELMP